MGTYIGHCDSCDVTLEAEEVIFLVKKQMRLLVQKYGEEKALEMMSFMRSEMNDLSDEWFITEPKSTRELLEGFVSPANVK